MNKAILDLYEEGLELFFRESKLDKYDNVEDTIQDYTETMMIFAFAVLFAPALPFVFALTWLNASVEIRSDAWKFLQLLQRPTLMLSDGIGSFHSAMEAITYVSAWTNSGLLFFTMPYFRHWSTSHRFAGFFISAILLNMIQWATLKTHYPESLEIQAKRSKIVIERFIEKVHYHFIQLYNCLPLSKLIT